MVRDQQLKSTDFLEIVRSKISFETNLELVDAVLGHAAGAQTRYVPAALRDAEAHRMFATARAGLLAAADQDTRIIWARALVGFGVERADLEYLGRLADDEERVPGFELDQDMRWGIAARHAGFDLPGCRGARARGDRA